MEDRNKYVKMQAVHFKTCAGKVTSGLRNTSNNYENLGENFFTSVFYMSFTQFIVTSP